MQQYVKDYLEEAWDLELASNKNGLSLQRKWLNSDIHDARHVSFGALLSGPFTCGWMSLLQDGAHGKSELGYSVP
jgi:hypothetical protein